MYTIKLSDEERNLLIELLSVAYVTKRDSLVMVKDAKRISDKVDRICALMIRMRDSKPYAY